MKYKCTLTQVNCPVLQTSMFIPSPAFNRTQVYTSQLPVRQINRLYSCCCTHSLPTYSKWIHASHWQTDRQTWSASTSMASCMVTGSASGGATPSAAPGITVLALILILTLTLRDRRDIRWVTLSLCCETELCCLALLRIGWGSKLNTESLLVRDTVNTHDNTLSSRCLPDSR